MIFGAWPSDADADADFAPSVCLGYDWTPVVLTSNTLGMDLFLEMAQVTKYGRKKPPTVSAVGRF
jgi:hypothetical protein